MTAPGAAAPARRPGGLALSRLLAVADHTDAHGRLLLEDSAPKRGRKEAQRRGVRMKSARCPFEDTPSRLGGQMNVSAFEALRRDTADILDGFAWLRARYGEVTPSASATVRTLFEVSYLALTVPLVLFHRAEDPVPAHGGLPTFVASMFKAGRGVFSAAVDMRNKQRHDAPLTPADIVAFAEREGHLARRETGRVCAAPTRFIERALGAMLTGAGADPDRSALGSLVDFDVVWEFFGVQDAVAEALSEYRYVVDGLRQRTGRSDIGSLFDQPLGAGTFAGTFGEYSAALVERANRAQDALNVVLGRRADAAPLDLPGVLRLL